MHSSQPSHYFQDAAMFFASWLRSPGKTGAVWPSSGYLADRLAAVLDTAEMPSEPRVAELGPGTGPATRRIQTRLTGRGRHVAVDLNPDFIRLLRDRYSGVEAVHESATELPRVLKDRDIDRVDAVISGLPFAAFPAALQREIMDAVVAVLDPEHGVFTTFNYVGAYSMPAAKRFRTLLGERFGEVRRHGPELRNVPPAYVLTAREPRK